MFQRHVLSSCERQPIEKLIEALPPVVASTVRVQASNIKKIDRLPFTSILVFSFDPAQSMPLTPRRDDTVAGVVTFEGANQIIVEVTVIFRLGLLDSLIFRPTSKPLKKQCRWIKTELKESLISKGEPLAEVATPLLRELASRHQLREAIKPAPKKLIGNLTETVGQIPKDLKQLLGETNGFRIGDYTFHGVDVRQIPSPEGDIAIFFEDDNAHDCLCLRETDETHHYWRYDEINEEFVDYGTSLIDAIDKLFANPYEEIG